MNLVLGYNGFARVLGRNHGDPGHPPASGAGAGRCTHGHRTGQPRRVRRLRQSGTGLRRLFSGEFGFEIGWLLPAALLAVVLVLISRRRAPRTDLVRAGAILFGGWLLVDGLVLSYMNGMIHPYYCLSLAPAVAGMFAIGVHEMWGKRSTWFGRLGLAVLIGSTGVWSWWILGRNAEWLPALRWTILAMTIAAIVALLLSLTSQEHRRRAAHRWCLGSPWRSPGRRPMRSRRSASPTTAATPTSDPEPQANRATQRAACGVQTSTTRHWTPCWAPPTPSGRQPSTDHRQPPVWSCPPTLR